MKKVFIIVSIVTMLNLGLGMGLWKPSDTWVIFSKGNAIAAAAPTVDELQGRWVSTNCEKNVGADGSASYLKRDFTLERTNWSVSYSLYGDAQCSAGTKQLTGRNVGTYELGATSPSVAGAREAVFGIAHEYLVADSPAMLANFNKASCGNGNWQLGAEQEIGDKGCLFVPPSSACTSEYDLVAIMDNQLYFGDRAKSLCNSPANRPTKLIQFSLTKSNIPQLAPNTGLGNTSQTGGVWSVNVVGLVVTLLAALTGIGFYLNKKKLPR